MGQWLAKPIPWAILRACPGPPGPPQTSCSVNHRVEASQPQISARLPATSATPRAGSQPRKLGPSPPPRIAQRHHSFYGQRLRSLLAAHASETGGRKAGGHSRTGQPARRAPSPRAHPAPSRPRNSSASRTQASCLTSARRCEGQHGAPRGRTRLPRPLCRDEGRRRHLSRSRHSRQSQSPTAPTKTRDKQLQARSETPPLELGPTGALPRMQTVFANGQREGCKAKHICGIQQQETKHTEIKEHSAQLRHGERASHDVDNSHGQRAHA